MSFARVRGSVRVIRVRAPEEVLLRLASGLRFGEAHAMGTDRGRHRHNTAIAASRRRASASAEPGKRRWASRHVPCTDMGVDPTREP